MVAQNKYVDEVYKKAPWVLTESRSVKNVEFILDNKIDWVCHDDLPYNTAGIDDAYSIPKAMGRFKGTKRTEGVSTTDVVAKILKNKEMYYVRNLRRGVPR